MYSSIRAAAILTSRLSFNAVAINSSNTGSSNCCHHLVLAKLFEVFSSRKRNVWGVSICGLS
ncbi:MAG: hypothetical protein HOC61_04910, partial [Rhodobacterales bacterium]|nr:hypothetical protein [Rhodobacterales bacterium]